MIITRSLASELALDSHGKLLGSRKSTEGARLPLREGRATSRARHSIAKANRPLPIRAIVVHEEISLTLGS